jgi:prepilin peptidase CpaA
MNNVFVLAALPVFLVGAALSDIARREIPNLLTASMAVVGVGVGVAGIGGTSLSRALLAGTVSLVIGIALQLGRLMGGGDVKLFAALGVWLGPSGTVDAALATAIAGGVLAIFYLRRSSAAGSISSAPASPLARLQLDDGPDFGRVPYGVAIAAGGLWVWLSRFGASAT